MEIRSSQSQHLTLSLHVLSIRVSEFSFPGDR
jgi:hypothetical protein